MVENEIITVEEGKCLTCQQKFYKSNAESRAEQHADETDHIVEITQKRITKTMYEKMDYN